MQRFIPFALLIVVLMFTSVSYAVEETPSTQSSTKTSTITPTKTRTMTKTAEKKEIQEKTVEAKKEAVELMQEKKKESSESGREAVEEKIDSFRKIKFEWVIKRLEAAINRLSNIIERLTTRIEKLKGEGVNVSQAETQLITATTNINKAETELVNTKSQLDEILAQETDIQDQTTFFNSVKLVKSYLIEGHKAIRQTIVALKSAIQSAKPSITPVATGSAVKKSPTPTKKIATPSAEL